MDSGIEALVAKMQYLGDRNILGLVGVILKWEFSPSYMLKRLLQNRVGNWYSEHVWKWIQNKKTPDTITCICCTVPMHSLQRLLFEPSLPVGAIEDMLSEMEDIQFSQDMIPRDVVVLYTVMFREASEETIVYFLDRVASDYKLDCELISQLAWSSRYSEALWKRLVKRSQKPALRHMMRFANYRPDLASLFAKA